MKKLVFLIIILLFSCSSAEVESFRNESATSTPLSLNLSSTVTTNEYVTTLTLTVTATGTSQSGSTVNIKTETDVATTSDYTHVDQQIAWTQGETDNRSLNVTINNDSISEGDETFKVILYNANGLTIGNATAVVTIKDDDNKRLFLTNTLYDGNLGGISGADTKCNTDSSRPDTGKTYKAVIGFDTTSNSITGAERRAQRTSTSGAAIDWIMSANTKYYNVDGSKLIGTTGTQAWLGPLTLDNSLITIASPIGQTKYWSGNYVFSDAGTTPDYTCSAWTSNSNSVTGVPGFPDTTGAPQFHGSSASNTKVTCDQQYALLCAEQ